MLRHVPALLLAAAVAVFASTASAEISPESDRAPAGNFSLDNLSGDSISLDDYEGKVVVISFWATWCVPCLQELPHLNGFYEVYQDDGLVVLAITTDGPETQSDVRSLVRRSRWSLEVLSDMDGAVSNVLNPRGTNPFTLYIDRAGRVAASHEGYSLGDEVMAEQYIQTLLAETL